jgi:hypothetical protein
LANVEDEDEELAALLWIAQIFRTPVSLWPIPHSKASEGFINLLLGDFQAAGMLRLAEGQF